MIWLWIFLAGVAFGAVVLVYEHGWSAFAPRYWKATLLVLVFVGVVFVVGAFLVLWADRLGHGAWDRLLGLIS